MEKFRYGQACTPITHCGHVITIWHRDGKTMAELRRQLIWRARDVILCAAHHKHVLRNLCQCFCW